VKIIKQGINSWSNLHNTVHQTVVDVYDLANEELSTALESYNDATKGIQGLLRESIRTKVPIRPLGGNWSLSPIAATAGIILNTKPLNSCFTISPASVSPFYKGDNNALCFAQCGNSIWELTKFLNARNFSLPACGASNGQTIAGAMATGTHGAALDFGAIHDAAVGLHIITGPDKHIYLERASHPVAADTFVAKLGAKLVRDDEAFNAAVCGLGAFGFVHGVMIEAEPIYLLEAYLRRVPFDAAFIKQITTLDFTHPKLPFPGQRPFHFQSLINPYDLDKGVYMTTMYKRPYHTGYIPPKPNGEGIGPGDDAPCFIGKLTGAVPALVPLLVNKVLAGSLTPYEGVTGTLGEMFNNTTLRGKVASAAVGLPAAQSGKVVDILLKVNKTAGPFCGLFAFRFVKKSRALMAFTRYDPTCVLELDGVECPQTQAFYEAVWTALEAAKIPFTFHWGKMNKLNTARVQRMYGANLQQFLSARARTIDSDTIAALSNNALKDWGIDSIGVEGKVLV
jgi:hypothetical protein